MRFVRALVTPAVVLCFLLGSTPAPSAVRSVGAQDQEEATQEKEKSRRKKRKEKRQESGARTGAMAGAIAGLALGAAVGEPGAGAAVGAAAGASSGMMYDYQQSRQDDNTQILAEGLAGRSPGEAGGSGSTDQPALTVGDLGRQKMQDLHGEWEFEAWGLDAEGGRITARGMATGLAAGDNATRLLFRDIDVDGYEEEEDLGGGSLVITYDPAQGFYLENNFRPTGETLNFVGEYKPDTNAFVFYLSAGKESEFIGGVLHSSVRVELRMASPALVVGDAFTFMEGKEVQIQQYRLTRP